MLRNRIELALLLCYLALAGCVRSNWRAAWRLVTQERN